jgi:hypothetical protein
MSEYAAEALDDGQRPVLLAPYSIVNAGFLMAGILDFSVAKIESALACSLLQQQAASVFVPLEASRRFSEQRTPKIE